MGIEIAYAVRGPVEDVQITHSAFAKSFQSVGYLLPSFFNVAVVEVIGRIITSR
jgi:hypothetical protein